MEDFLFLGQLPGTSIHISFGAWLVGAVTASLLLAIVYDRKHGQRLFFSALYVSMHLQKRRMLKHFDKVAL